MWVIFKHKWYPCHGWNRSPSKINRRLHCHILQLPVCCQHRILSSFMPHICSLTPRLPSEAKWLVALERKPGRCWQNSLLQAPLQTDKTDLDRSRFNSLSLRQSSDVIPTDLVSSVPYVRPWPATSKQYILWISKSQMLNKKLSGPRGSRGHLGQERSQIRPRRPKERSCSWATWTGVTLHHLAWGQRLPVGQLPWEHRQGPGEARADTGAPKRRALLPGLRLECKLFTPIGASPRHQLSLGRLGWPLQPFSSEGG